MHLCIQTISEPTAQANYLGKMATTQRWHTGLGRMTDLSTLAQLDTACHSFAHLGAPWRSLAQLGSALQGQPCIFFVDNDGAGFGLAKGLWGSADFDSLLSSFWGLAAALMVVPWVARVCSGSNPADATSHGHLRLPVRQTSASSLLPAAWRFLEQVFQEEGIPTRRAIFQTRDAINASGVKPPGLPLGPLSGPLPESDFQ